MLSLEVYLISIFVVIVLGLYNIMNSKNIVKIILIIEMMLTAVNLLILFIAQGRDSDPLGQAIVITSIVIGAGLKLSPGAIFKADLQIVSDASRKDYTNILNIGFGYWF